MVAVFISSADIAYGGWEILIKEFSQKDRAEKFVKELQSSNIKVRLEKEYKYRVYAGEFKSRAAALKKAKNIRTKTDLPGKLISKKMPLVKKVGSLRDGEKKNIETVKELEIHIVKNALDLLGTDYIYGGATREIGLDCSGFVKNVFQTAGFRLPRMVKDQVSRGTKITKEQLRPGDLLFFKTETGNIDHVGIYLGQNDFIHSAQISGRVKIDNFSRKSYYRKNFVQAKRLIK
ncbi:MAG: C40 family peptidase [Elusimicrobiota bacterium]